MEQFFKQGVVSVSELVAVIGDKALYCLSEGATIEDVLFILTILEENKVEYNLGKVYDMLLGEGDEIPYDVDLENTDEAMLKILQFLRDTHGPSFEDHKYILNFVALVWENDDWIKSKEFVWTYCYGTTSRFLRYLNEDEDMDEVREILCQRSKEDLSEILYDFVNESLKTTCGYNNIPSRFQEKVIMLVECGANPWTTYGLVPQTTFDLLLTNGAYTNLLEEMDRR